MFGKLELSKNQPKLAKNNPEKVVSFFEKNLTANNDGIASEEFRCPFGIRAAIKRKQIVICVVNNEIVAAMRFYPRKTSPNVASLYQFAIDKKYRDKGLLQKMLLFTGCKAFESLCPIKSDFNNYYKKTGWVLKSQDQENNCWSLSL